MFFLTIHLISLTGVGNIGKGVNVSEVQNIIGEVKKSGFEMTGLLDTNENFVSSPLGCHLVLAMHPSSLKKDGQAELLRIPGLCVDESDNSFG